VKPLFARFQASKPWRAWKRYGEARGNILAAGVGYFAFFSIFPLLLVLVTLLGYALEGDPGLQHRVLDSALADFPVIGTPTCWDRSRPI